MRLISVRDHLYEMCLQRCLGFDCATFLRLWRHIGLCWNVDMCKSESLQSHEIESRAQQTDFMNAHSKPRALSYI